MRCGHKLYRIRDNPGFVCVWGGSGISKTRLRFGVSGSQSGMMSGTKRTFFVFVPG